MKQSLQKLQRIFHLEASNGYNNRAVIGGVDRILDPWQAEARLEGVAEEIIQAVQARLRDYPRLTPTSRAEVLEGLWRRIQRLDAEVEPLSTPKAAPTRPAERSGETAGGSPAGGRKGAKAPRPAKTAPPSRPQGKPTRDPSPLEAEPAYPTGDADEGGAPPSWETSHPLNLPPNVPAADAALSAPTTVLPGIGPAHAQTLGRLGIHTLRDMLYFFPRRYDDYSQLKPINRLWYGEEVTVIAVVQSVQKRPLKGGKLSLIEAIVSDGTGALRLQWFNQVYVAQRLRPGMNIVVSGKIDQYLGRLIMKSPEWEAVEDEQISTNRIVPVYPLTAQITQRWLRRVMNQLVSFWAPRVQDPLPASLRQAAGILDLPTALMEAHFPSSQERLAQARHRLAFDEIFLLQLGVLAQKQLWQDRSARLFAVPSEWLAEQIAALPYDLTGAQRRAVEDVRVDLLAGRPMNRLLQGDVGAGKTIVAALAAAMVMRTGAQAAVMAPTSILAEQHYRSLSRILTEGANPLLQPDEIRLLVGATSEAEKRELRTALADGQIKLLIGTHALIEDPITFADLQLIVVDEQHRFGVEQRAALRAKGDNPHLLVMTATPIPRSLALTVYGDLELTVLDEMPPGRQQVSTHILPPRERERAYSLIRSQIAAGRQAFIIYPLVEESDKSESKAAVEEHALLQAEVFPQLKLGLLHGRLRPEEKEAVMTAFRDGDFDILVSTSVVEVGVDIPNATVMLIEGADRFGLAQLHQFRGRVGRGAEKSYCLLIPESADKVENERLQVMVETNDGFVLAERDLDQRGPGQFLGTRQSGFSELQMASLTDVRLIEKARRHAQALFETDPDLSAPELGALQEAVRVFWAAAKGDIS